MLLVSYEQGARGALEKLGCPMHCLCLWGEELAVIGPQPIEREQALAAALSERSGIHRVTAISSPDILAARAAREHRSLVSVGDVEVGGREFVVMAGPCAVENPPQLEEVARAVRSAGARVLRGGAFKPRTSPFSFQGLGRPALAMLGEIRSATGMPVVSELMDQRELEAMDGWVDLLQIGMRNAQNFALLRDVGRLASKRPVLLKSGAGTTLDELLCAADHILCQGNPNVILCLRGGVSNSRDSRASINLAEIPALRLRTHLPIIVDPSHAAGRWELVPPMAAAALAAGADGLIVEVHGHPEEAHCDGKQALLPERFAAMMARLRLLALSMGRTIAPARLEPLRCPEPPEPHPYNDLCLEAPPAGVPRERSAEPRFAPRAISGSLGSLLAALLVLGGSACHQLDAIEDGPENVRQGGALTVFDSTALAYDLPSPPVESVPELMRRFRRGDTEYALEHVASPATVPGTGGLGPLYVGRSCTSCHQGAGRTKPTLFTHGGSGFDFSSHLVFMKSRNGFFFKEYGRVLHDQAIFGAKPEGRLSVKYTEQCGEFPTPDRERYCLVTPTYEIRDWYTTPPSEKDLLISVRTPLRHIGLGLMMALDRDELIALSQLSYPEYGITPKLQWIVERGVYEIGVGGHKAQHSDLTVELGFSSDMGITNHRFPESVAKGQEQVTTDEEIEVDDAVMADVDFYMQTTGVPARRNVKGPVVQRGQRMFERAACHLCHVPTLHTSRIPPKLIDGTPMPMLAGQTIHPYSDFLLHDMGPALGDEFDQFLATGREWRTAPLWGVGLQSVVNGHMHLLHDGRARNLVEAILWHREEEGAVSTEIFRHMPKEDRDALVAFLMSL